MSGGDPDTIFALGSGVGRSAIAVIRLSGPACRFALETIAAPLPRARFAALRKLRHPQSGRVLDEAIVLYFPGPRSETGEDCAEFQVHGSRAVIAALIDVLGGLPGCRPAESGEFAQRALRNGKMDLLGVEALADLIDSQTELQRRQAIEGGGALLRQTADRWRAALLDLSADLETNIDFSDEGDVADQFDSAAEQLLERLIADMRQVLAVSARPERLREGFRVALLGAPNAGKSSLINALAGRDVAIVSTVPGTTRDRIEVALELRGIPVVVTDTAGLQETSDLVEQEGIRRSLASAEEADLVLWLRAPDQPDHSAAFMPPAAAARWIVATKTDLADGGPIVPTADLAVSARTGAGMDVLIERIAGVADNALGFREAPLITRARHRARIEECVGELASARAVARDVELCAEHIRLAGVALERLVGRVDIEEVLGAIFSRFCIGK